MKKLLLLAFALMALNLTFTSCSKDDDVATPDSLVGTSWTASFEETVEEVPVAVGITLNFTTATVVTAKLSAYGVEVDAEPGTYTYVKPVVTLSFEEFVNGTVDGNKMTFSYEGETIVFTRK